MKNLQIDLRRVFLMVGILILTFVIVEFNSRLEELDRLNRQVKITRAEATQVAETKVALETQVVNAESDQVVEEQARSEGHMIQDGDHPIIIFGDENITPSDNPEPTIIPTLKPNWLKWRDLYFGEE